jgi:hypothetical protein
MHAQQRGRVQHGLRALGGVGLLQTRNNHSEK